MKYITAIGGLSVGHWTEPAALTGCTAIICENGAVCGVDVRGSAPGTRETDLLRGYNSVTGINAVMLCGGSAFGLDAASGAMRYLEERGLGVDVGTGVVPIVPAAVIFDLGVGDSRIRPTKDDGYAACLDAKAGVYSTGRVGVGTGATVGKAFGPKFAMSSGIGSSCIDIGGGVKIGALVAVNALGDVYNPETGCIVAGARDSDGFLNCMSMTSQSAAPAGFTNTTIGVIATNASLTREEANKIASMGHDGLAMTIKPVHTHLDGDTLFALSTGEVQNVSMLSIMIGAVKAVSLAVLDAVSM
jgi:L-aminopeptidase/D-esterase-like protein